MKVEVVQPDGGSSLFVRIEMDPLNQIEIVLAPESVRHGERIRRRVIRMGWHRRPSIRHKWGGKDSQRKSIGYGTLNLTDMEIER
jgi:hypothetical protein